MKNDAILFKNCLLAGFKNLENKKEIVNSLNVFPVPDGDTGTNMTLTIKSAISKVNSVSDITIANLAKAMSDGSLMGARGNSGVITSQIMRGFYNGFKDYEKFDVFALRDGFVESYKTAYKAVMKPTEGTILTVSRCMGEFAEENYQNYKDIKTFLTDIISTGNKALLKTKEMLPVLKEADVVDAGGQGLMLFLEGVLNYDNEQLISETTIDESSRTINDDSTQNLNQDIEFGYCTEFFIMTDEDENEYRNKLKDFGDCILVVKGDGVIKTHIHTNHPGKVMEIALEIGALKDIKVDNMRLQHQNLHSTEEEIKNCKDKKDEPEKDFGFVVVSSGEGFNKVFDMLNVDEIITGGQTMNPSTEDIVNSIEKVNAKTVFVFPNNKNIILAANQAKQIVEKDVYVVESKSVPQSISAILAFNEQASSEENFESFNDVISSVKTGEVTFAVKDLNMQDIKVKKDDIIGLDQKNIRAVGTDINKVSMDLLRQLIEKDDSLVTIYYGEGCDEMAASKLKDELENEYKDIDIEVVEGSQPLYYYVFSIE
ncbi:DAK2 domain-containing protein [uncultured Finegoldia sp.]|uniref:DAK2 domain-containing protein n=1 Tax=uncultured Finegoldia sp. TaxID=328009 RepID=UPI0026258839|nr:DAK2 domain-containing protein [uncultured Finegoldia sp.]